jgi:integrase
VKKHTKRLEAVYGERNYGSLTDEDYEHFLKTKIGGSGKNRMNHLITYRAMSRWARDKRQYLPLGPTAAENCPTPKVVKTEHEVYSPNEFKRLLVAAPTKMVMFYVLGQLSGVRAEERRRIRWEHWRRDEDNKLVLNADVTKTNLRRRVDVCPALELWLAAFRTNDEDYLIPIRKPAEHMGNVRRAAGVPLKTNALRAGFASYHIEKFGDLESTAKNDGHTVAELKSTYMSISGVTKAAADEMFDTTPQAVLEFAKANALPDARVGQPDSDHRRRRGVG